MSHTQCPVDPQHLQAIRTTHMHGSDGVQSQFVDQWTDPKVAHAVIGQQSWIGRTVFQIQPGVELGHIPLLPLIRLRQKCASPNGPMDAEAASPAACPSEGEQHAVIEVFSPPRFALECAKFNLPCISADLCTGWDFRKVSDRNRMRDIIQHSPPELLVLCPPCTWAGGWYHLNKLKMSPRRGQREKHVDPLVHQFLPTADRTAAEEWWSCDV